jgi:uncharacterized RmlC-like cupin family protein
MLSGDEMELWTGDQLQYREVVRPGDYIFTPASILHVAVNRGLQPAVFIGARNEATAHSCSPKWTERCRKKLDQAKMPASLFAQADKVIE